MRLHQKRFRVATWDEVAHYGAASLPRGLRPPVGGGAGWAFVQGPAATAATNAGTVGKTEAFASNVTIGHVLVIGAIYASTTTTPTWTFSDSQTGPTNTWTQLGTQLDTNVGAVTALAFTVAGQTGACTPKWVNNQAASVDCEIYIGEFTPPAGTVAQDGAATTNVASGATSITTPAGGGAGANDLVLNMLGFSNSWTGWGGAWASVCTGVNGNALGYLINAAGNSTPNALASGGSNIMSLVADLKVTAGAAAHSLVTDQRRTRRNSLLRR